MDEGDVEKKSDSVLAAAPRRITRLASLAMCIAIGSALGSGAFTFDFAEGTSYLSNDSASCANCHVMQRHYDAWLNSSHRAHAQCNDCHSDPTTIATKLKCKAVNGLFHSYAFTTSDFHEPIQMTDWNRKQTEVACRKCHEGMVHQIDFPSLNPNDQQMSCTRCHADVGHPWK